MNGYVGRQKWLIAINRSDLSEEKMTWLKVCQEHFVTGMPAHLEDVQHTDWVPSKNLGYGKDVSATSYSRYQRAKNRSKVPLSSGSISNLNDDAAASFDGDAAASFDGDAAASFDGDAVAPLDAEAVARLDAEAVAPPDAEAVAPLDAEAVAPPDDEAVAPPDDDTVAPPYDDGVAPLDDDGVAPLDEGAVIVLRDNTKRGRTISVQTETTMQDLIALQLSYDAAVSELTEVKERLRKMSLNRGFNVKDEVELYCAEIKVPAFTKGKKQLSPLDIENTRALAHVRIHVERVIGVLRQKYRILHDIMPISLIKKTTKDAPSTVDQIVYVCCCLTNMCPSVVPFD
ncbi:hypothetical protein JTE90_001850 [Oedothorax gibbosus]|uniref:DDE Tnp4 domain-containing protein n=1 Tax=Oedothorax gibbosus TaxID=931172 RepID=A0AAV6VNG3_9ARAC|nr:hypothetical protein JTE90_001850 [Oedothorax gibbosus]